jgi:ABC-type microcin C transport system permease subunit YejE
MRSVMQARSLDYVTAAQAIGCSTPSCGDPAQHPNSLVVVATVG